MSNKIKVTLSCIGRFHHFHLARQFERFEVLDQIWSAYPMFKLKDELGIDFNKIHTESWLRVLYLVANKKAGQVLPNSFLEYLSYYSKINLDTKVSKSLTSSNVLIALSSSGLESGRQVQQQGGVYFCDRGSSHISFQDEILREEYALWGLHYSPIDPRIIEREELEYQQADFISVPSDFVANSFIEKGISVDKVFKNPYGARLDRFSKVSEPEEGKLSLLYVGQVSLRKGFLYLLEAFNLIDYPNKSLTVIGSMQAEIKPLLEKFNLENVNFLGNVPNADLPKYYSSSTALVLPSIEEGLAMVQGEALACGCPVIATHNTGAGDLFSDGEEGFILNIRSPIEIKDAIMKLVDDPDLRSIMSKKALVKVKSINGWNSYGERWYEKLQESIK